MSQEKSLKDFLQFIVSQQEASLAIAKDETQLSEWKKTLEEEGFIPVTTREELVAHATTPGKIYYVIENNLPKNIYDFCIEYREKRIQEFTPELSVIVPTYTDIAILFIGVQDTVFAVQEEGYHFLENVGFTYRT